QHTAKAVETTVDEPILPDIAPLAPPLRFDGWRLMPMAAGVRWQRVRSWWLINFIRLLGLGTLSVLFLILGIGSKTRGLAEVDLAHLPDIGLFIGALLLITLMLSIWRLLRESATVVDTLQREVYEKGLLLPFINWRIPFDNIQYLLITQSSPRAQGRRRKDEPMN